MGTAALSGAPDGAAAGGSPARRVLVLAYYFPPVGGGGVQRTRKFVEYLPGCGFEPVVLTGPVDRALAWAPDDPTLAGSIPAGTEVVRLEGPEPPRTRLRGRAERWLRIAAPHTRWWIEGAVAVGREPARTADLIYASMSPFGSGEAAARLARETGRPWVADLRDPWALDEWQVYPSAVHHRLELRRMRRTLASAAAIVMNTPEAAAALRRAFPELGDIPVATIPNGFDPADFDGPPPPREDGVLRIVHAGWSHSASGRRHRRLRRLRGVLGGVTPGLDILTRSDLHLLAAVDRLLAARPDLRGRIEVHLAGVAAEGDRGRYGEVRRRGYLPHAETIALLRSADLLFLPMHDLPAGVRSRIVPGKTYEYLAAGPPILAAVPDGDARDLLTRAGTAHVVRPADEAAIERAILAELARRDAGEPRPAPDPDLLARFERRRLTRALAEVFEGTLGDRAARPA
jgi:glycosyltransferase involved in cell wall biosynthesis